MKRLLTALITALLVLQISAPAYAAYEARSIVISGVEGRDVSMTKGTAKTFAAKANMKLADGYTVSTGTASYCTLKLDNDTLVRIDQKSKIQVSKVSGKKLAVSILSGAVKVDAGPQKDGDTIEVKAGNSALAIRGTLFVAENVPDGDAGAFMVTMLEGSGSVNGHILLAGQTMYVYDASEDKLHEVSDFDITGGSLFVLETIMEHWEELSEALDVLSFTFDELSDKAEELREAAASAPEPPAVTQSVTRTESTQSGGQGGTQGGQGAQGGTQDGQGGQDNTQGGAQGGGQGAQGGGQTPIPAISIAAIPGLTAPVAGAEPVGYVATAQYTGIVTWWPPVADTFEHDTAYIAMVTLTPRPGYTLTGVAANFFTAAGAEASNPANSGVVTAVFPATEPAPDTVISIAAIPGLTAPVAGAEPVESIATAQYTGVVAWSPSVVDTFERDTPYTATVTLTPAAGYTLEGVSENFFTVAGAEASNPANSGDVTAVFPAAERRGVTLKLLSAIQQVPEASPTSPPPYYTEHTETSLGDMAEVTLDDVKTAMGEVLEGYVITGFMTENDPGAELHTSTSISGTATTLYVRVDGRGDMRFPKWIYSPGDLDRVRNGLDLNYLMMANITMHSAGTLSSFEPIGADDDDPFTGTFDGGGKTIYGLKIETDGYSGLFGSLGFGGVVSNLGLKSAAISGQNTGGIAGHNYGSISGCFVADSNCFVADSIFGSYVGGIAGQNDGSISNSFVADSSVSGSTVGGIAGHSGLSISNCFVIDSEISGTMAGGIAGQNGSYIDNCFVAGDGFVAGPEAGGIVGRNYYGDISKCYVAVSVTGADYGNYTPQYIGGIVGTLSTEGTVSNCVMLGAEVYGTDAIVNRIGTSSILQNNYAWEGTKVNEADVLNGNHSNENGANATINNLEDKDWWAGVGFDFDNDRIWTFNDDGPPTLTWYSEP